MQRRSVVGSDDLGFTELHMTPRDLDRLFPCDAQEETPPAQVEVRSERASFHVYPLQTLYCSGSLMHVKRSCV